MAEANTDVKGAPDTSLASGAKDDAAVLKPGDAGYVAPDTKAELKPGDVGYVAPEVVKPEDARAYLVSKGQKAEDLAKLSEADLLKAHADAKKAEAEGPTTYKDFTTPEGIKLDPKLVTDLQAIIGPLKVPQEAAQKLVDMHVAQLKEVVDKPYKDWKDLQTKWVGDIKADPELGGIKFDETGSVIAKVLDHIGGKESKALRDALDMTGAGNNPEIVRFIVRVGKAFTEGGIVLGTKPNAEANKSPAQTLYPNQGQAKT